MLSLFQLPWTIEVTSSSERMRCPASPDRHSVVNTYKTKSNLFGSSTLQNSTFVHPACHWLQLSQVILPSGPSYWLIWIASETDGILVCSFLATWTVLPWDTGQWPPTLGGVSYSRWPFQQSLTHPSQASPGQFDGNKVSLCRAGPGSSLSLG